VLAGSSGTRLPLTGLLERQLGAAVARAGGGTLAGLDARAREALLPRGGAVLRGLCAALHDSSILVQRGVLDVPPLPLRGSTARRRGAMRARSCSWPEVRRRRPWRAAWRGVSSRAGCEACPQLIAAHFPVGAALINSDNQLLTPEEWAQLTRAALVLFTRPRPAAPPPHRPTAPPPRRPQLSRQAPQAGPLTFPPPARLAPRAIGRGRRRGPRACGAARGLPSGG